MHFVWELVMVLGTCDGEKKLRNHEFYESHEFLNSSLLLFTQRVNIARFQKTSLFLPCILCILSIVASAKSDPWFPKKFVKFVKFVISNIYAPKAQSILYSVYPVRRSFPGLRSFSEVGGEDWRAGIRGASKAAA